jgi:head-tail adaptor
MADLTPRVRAGRNRQRVTLQRATTADDALGTPEPTWSDLLTFYALVRPAAGSEPLVAGQLAGRVSHVVECRHLGAAVVPTVSDRLSFRGRVLNLFAVLDADERRRAYYLLAGEPTTP